jgi:lysophospholipase L1-like esterase
MHSIILLSAYLFACHGGTKDTSSDSFQPAIDETSSPDRVGTYAHRLPDSPDTVIFLGDSITAGAGSPGDDEDYVRLLVNNTNTWPDWDGKDLATRYPGIEVVDVSKSGSWTGTVLNDQLARLEELVTLPFEGEVLVVITVGGNDLQSVLLNPSIVEERLEKTVDNWRKIAEYFLDEQRFPDGSTVLMANVYEPTDTVGQAGDCFYGFNISSLLPSLHDANLQLRGLAEELGFSVLDMRGTFLGHGFNYNDPNTPYYVEDDPSLWLANDCIHPNPRGHHEIRTMFWRAIDGQ